MKTKNENGFTLLELIVIIVILGITLPLVIMPFVTAAGSAARPADMGMLASINRGGMERELAGIDQNWPSALDPDFSANTFNETIDGRQYATTVEKRFVDASFSDTDGDSAMNRNRYLLLSVTTTDSAGNALNLQAVKARDY